MYPVPICDVLEVIKSDEFAFSNSGITIPGDGQMNICIKAYYLMQREYEITPIKIHLHKVIPMGGGLGGGSSDGTYTLKAIDSLFDLKLSTTRLQELAAQLGSDCPFFVTALPQVATGRGEFLENIDFSLKGSYLYLINLGIHVSTAKAFSKVEFYMKNTSIAKIIKQPFKKIKSELVNSFETSVFESYPVLAEIKSRFTKEGAFYASMSGSGSTMYGIFSEKPEKGMFADFDVAFEEIVAL
jgi:4-diphosphocytidyl-2-C-methyl-D-erythritol kinase